MPSAIGRGGLATAETILDAQWDTFLAQCKFAHHEQSSAFGRNRAGYGFSVERVVTQAKGKITGGAQILVRGAPLGKFATVQRGPVALSDDPEILGEAARILDRHASEQGYRALRIDLFPHQIAASDALKEAGFSRIRNIAGMRSVSVPLNHAERKLLLGMSSRVEREVRRATAKGVEIRTGRETLADFYALYQMTSIHHGFPIFPPDYFDTLLRTLDGAGRLHPFVAYLGNRPLAGILNCVVGEEMYYGWGGMSRVPEDMALRANFLLHWSAMSHARRNGLNRYDLAGESPFKKWFAFETIEWPAPLWRFYGWLGPAYARTTSAFAAPSRWVRILQRVARRMRTPQKMPY